MAAKYGEARWLPGQMNVYVQMIRAIGNAGIGISYVNEMSRPNSVVFNLSHSVSMSSWGEDIRVTLTAQGNQTYADVYSECSLPTQIVDWGKNKENVYKIFNYITRAVNPYAAQPAPQTYAPQQYAQQPAAQYRPMNQPLQNTAFCPNCGAVVNSQSTFCTCCGKKLKD